MHTIQMEEAFEKNRHMVIAEQDGDLDKAGEAVLKQRAALKGVEAIAVSMSTQLSMKERLGIVAKLDKIKEVRGSL